MNDSAVPALTPAGRYIVLVCAFLGWFCAGFHLSISSLAMQPAAVDLLGRTGSLDVARYQALNKLVPKKNSTSSTMSASEKVEWESMKTVVSRWFAWLTCAFLFGAASGGLLFGRLGDRFGRSKAMAWSILTYSIMAGAASLAQSPVQLLVLWYLACTGVGGMWPNGVALVSEAWSNLSRAAAAGVIGTSANIGIFLVSTLAAKISVVTTVDGKSSYAELFVDGRSQGEAPTQLELKPGKHRIRLVRDGFRASESVLEVIAGRDERLVVDLKR